MKAVDPRTDVPYVGMQAHIVRPRLELSERISGSQSILPARPRQIIDWSSDLLRVDEHARGPGKRKLRSA